MDGIVLQLIFQLLLIKTKQKNNMVGLMELRLEWTRLPHICLLCICMAVRLGWTVCHTFVSYLCGSKAWVD